MTSPTPRRSSGQRRLFWAALAAPGIIWLAVLFIVPFYAILAIAGGQLDIFGNPMAVWNPLQWSSANYTGAWHGRSQSVWQGFSWRWYFTDPVNSVLHNPDLHAAVVQTFRLSVYVTLITVPLGVAFALGIHRWRGPLSSSFNFIMILSFVIPELIFGVAMFFVFTKLFTGVGLGSLAEVLALVTWNVSWPALIVQARLTTIGRQYAEAAADLGATPWQVTHRVMIRLLTPAIFASAVLVFSGVIGAWCVPPEAESRPHPSAAPAQTR